MTDQPIPILLDHLQDQYVSQRRLWRESYLEWLAARKLPGKPVTEYKPDPLAVEPIRHDPILGSA